MNKICDLSRKQANDYRRFGTIPDCAAHGHLSKKAADTMEAMGLFCFITEHRGERIRPRTWKRRNSGGVPVMQYVEIKGRRKRG